MKRIRGDHYYNSSIGWPRIGITNRPKCKCNFEGENVNRVGRGGCSETLERLKLIRSSPAVKFQLVVRVKMIIARPNGALFLSFFRMIVQNSVIVRVRRLRYAYAFVCVCVCRNICTYNWNRFPSRLKNNKKKRGQVEAIYTRWPRIDLKIQSNLKLFELAF